MIYLALIICTKVKDAQMKNPIKSITILATATLLLSGCAASLDSATNEPGEQIAHVSFVEPFTTVDSFLKQTDYVVLAEAVSNREYMVETLPYTSTTFRLISTIKGQSLTEEFTVVYTGGKSLKINELPGIPVLGKQYVLALTDFYFEAGKSTGDYIVVGPAQWALSGVNNSFAELDLVDLDMLGDLENSDIPFSIATDELIELF